MPEVLMVYVTSVPFFELCNKCYMWGLLKLGGSLVPRPFEGETAWPLTQVQSVYRYDVTELKAAPVQALSIG